MTYPISFRRKVLSVRERRTSQSRKWRSVKYEEVYLNAYESALEAKQSLTKYFRFYNENQKHQTLVATPNQVYYESIRLSKAG